MMIRSLIAVDPGLNSAGFAEYLDNGHYFADLWKTDRSLTWERRAAIQCSRLAGSMRGHLRYRVTIELPQMFGGAGGRMVAARGDLVKLAFLVGGLARTAHDHGAQVVLVEPVRWKGQMSKELVKRRIVRILGARECRGFEHDMWDAVGILLWAQGKL